MTDRKTIVLRAARWFDSENGNTYHVACVIVGERRSVSGITYGYGSHYEHTAGELSRAMGVMPDGVSAYDLRRWADRTGYRLDVAVIDLDTRAELVAWARGAEG